MVIIETSSSFEIRFNYNPRIIDQVRSIPGRKYDYNQKIWTAPITSRQYVEQFARKNNFRFDGQVKAREKVEYNIPPMPDLEISIPLKRELFPFQKKGVAYALAKERLIVGDAMGLGKTAQAIATIVASNSLPCLVICPNSLKINWQREFEQWSNLKPMILGDSVKKTWNYFWDHNMVQVFIVNYESLKKYFVVDIKKGPDEPLRLNHVLFNEKINLFKSVIIDESHRCKDSRTQQAKFVKGIAAGKKFILALTGTPVVNKPRDLVAQLGIIDRMKEFGGYKGFVNHYCDGMDGATNLDELNFMLKKHCFYRRDKSEVLKELPSKMRQMVLCDISTRKEYNEALADLESYLIKYRQATDEQVQRSMRGEVMVRIGILKNISARGKLNDVVEYVSDIIESGEKIVVFIHLKEIAAALKKHFPEAVSILGEDDQLSRQRSIDSFQNNPNTKLIICSIKAAGVGITLTASSRVAFVELPWHAADSEQCEDRCIIEGEPILTPNGWVPVEQIKKGDLVINRYGNSTTVTDAWNKGNTKLVTEIHIEGWGSVRTTSDHQYLTDEGWKDACTILPGNKIVMPKQIYDSPDLLSIPFDNECRLPKTFKGKFGQEIENGRLINAPEEISITDDALFAFGYFTGDGFASTIKGKGRFISVAGHKIKKKKSLDRCCKWFDAIGLNHYERIDNGELGTEIRAYSGEWAMFFEKHFGKKAYAKMLPEFLMQLNTRQSRIVLSGLMASDGYYRMGRYEYVTSSGMLASQVARIILRAGYRPTLSKNATGQALIAYAETQTNNLALVQSVFTYFPKKINGKRPKVYDLTTDDTESFVVGLSVVHNCHRIGQKDSVQCMYFLGKDTIDEWIYKIIEEKRGVAYAITGAKDDVERSVMDGIINLFNKGVSKNDSIK
jgi:SWI/SNF-related matrix-associated actin-dependent regulator of chromatin subfamily A-like protein 1